jgi:hypothetical protein
MRQRTDKQKHRFARFCGGLGVAAATPYQGGSARMRPAPERRFRLRLLRRDGLARREGGRVESQAVVEGCWLRVEGQEECCSSNDLRRPLNILLCFSQAPYKRLKSVSDKKPCRFEMVACETTSNNEPVAISTKRAKSGRDDRELPSARFDEMETAARRIWFVKPNRSVSGKVRVRV